MVVSNAVPRVSTVYHLMLAPEAVKPVTVAELQNVCVASPVGGEGIFTMAIISNLSRLSQLPMVCVAK